MKPFLRFFIFLPSVSVSVFICLPPVSVSVFIFLPFVSISVFIFPLFEMVVKIFHNPLFGLTETSAERKYRMSVAGT